MYCISANLSADDEPILPPPQESMGCLDLPPVDSFDFLDINNLVFDWKLSALLVYMIGTNDKDKLRSCIVDKLLHQ